MPPRIATAAAALLLCWQAIGLLLLPSALVVEAFQPSAEHRAKAAEGSFCVLGGECPPIPLPNEDPDPCKLICVAHAGALSWLGLTGLVPDTGELRGSLGSVPVPDAAPRLTVDRPSRPLVPPPRV